MAALTRANAAGATDKRRSPIPNRAGMQRGSLAMSPQTLTEIRRALACSTTWRMRRSTPGCSGSVNAATAWESRLQAVTYCIRSLDPNVLLLVNGLGGTPIAELYLLFNSARRLLNERNLNVQRSLVGSFTTSLEMAGASLTLCVLDDEIVAHWDSPVHTPALRWRI